MKYIAGQSTLAYDPGRCTGCRLCSKVCPHGVFAMGAKKAVLLEKDRCMECGACALNCEALAITVAAGVGCAAAIINGMITGGDPVCGCAGEDDSSSGGCC